MTVREILDAARALPRVERVRLLEELRRELRVERSPSAGTSSATGSELRSWLDGLLARAPSSPALPSEAFERENIYGD
jgi:hypothetical protein